MKKYLTLCITLLMIFPLVTSSATIYLTNSTDTMGTMRTNNNSSLTNLNNAISNTTSTLGNLASLTYATGTLIVGNSNGWNVVPVGTNGYVLVASSTATNGVDWVANTAGIASLNGSTSSTQTFATASSSNTFSIGTSNGVHTLTIPNNVGWYTNDANYIILTSLSSSATGITYNNTTGAFSWTSGYEGLKTASSTDWNTAYADRLKWDGGATGLVAATGRTSLGLTDTATTASSSFAKATTDSAPILYGTKQLCAWTVQFSTSTTTWYDNMCIIGVSSTITAVKYVNQTANDSETWNVYYGTSGLATTTNKYPLFSSDQTTTSTDVISLTPTASSTPNADTILMLKTSNTSSSQFTIYVYGKDR